MIEWFDDLKVGMRFKTGEATVSKEDIKRFAAEFDPQPFHLDRQAADVAAFRRVEALELPDTLDFSQMTALSNEVRQKLESIRPRTVGQAGRIDGVTPAALTLIAAHIRRGGKKKSAKA